MNIEKLAAVAVYHKSIDELKECFALLDKYAADYRDIISNVGIIYDAASRLNVSPDLFLKEGEQIVQSQVVREELAKFVERKHEDKKLQVFGYRYQETLEPKYVFSFL